MQTASHTAPLASFASSVAELAVTWLNEKARLPVEPLARELSASIAMPLDVERHGAMEAAFAAIAQKWGQLDFVLHSIAYAPAPDMGGRVVDTSREGFARAMDISCHSFIRMARLAEPLMDKGGALLTMSYLGAAEVVPHYGLMGPVKAALEASVRYVATELGPRGIRVNAFRPVQSRPAQHPVSHSSTRRSRRSRQAEPHPGSRSMRPSPITRPSCIFVSALRRNSACTPRPL